MKESNKYSTEEVTIIRNIAVLLHAGEYITVDDNPSIVSTPEGVWVRAWVCVPSDELEDLEDGKAPFVLDLESAKPPFVWASGVADMKLPGDK